MHARGGRRYVLPKGSRARAFATNPANPAIANGCNVMAASGSAFDTEPVPRKNSTRPPPRALAFNMKAGKAGRKARSAGLVVDVISSPVTRSPRETTIPDKGPAIAKSNMDLRSGGGERRGVIVPSNPSWIEGIRFGVPVSNFQVVSEMCKQ